MTIDAGTTSFYDRYAVDAEEADRSAISRHFEAAFPPGARVLDVGCGRGRDLAVLLDSGFDAWGVEPNDAMRLRALERHPGLAGRIAAASLPALVQPFGDRFDAIVCSAVLMHLAPTDLVAALATFDALLAPAGRLLLSVPELQHDKLADDHDPDGRAFFNHLPEHLQRLLAERGFAVLGRWEIATPDTRWRVLLFGRGVG